MDAFLIGASIPVKAMFIVRYQSQTTGATVMPWYTILYYKVLYYDILYTLLYYFWHNTHSFKIVANAMSCSSILYYNVLQYTILSYSYESNYLFLSLCCLPYLYLYYLYLIYIYIFLYLYIMAWLCRASPSCSWFHSSHGYWYPLEV